MPQQSQRIEFEGKVHEFPADFTQQDIQKALHSHKPPAVGTPDFNQNLQRAKQRVATTSMNEADAAAQNPNPLLNAPQPGEDPRATLGRQAMGNAYEMVKGFGDLLRPGPEDVTAGTGGGILARMFVNPAVEEYEHGATKLGAIPIIGPMAASMGRNAGSGNYVGAVVDATQLATMTPELAEAGSRFAPKALPDVGTLRRQAQRMVGASPESVTRPLVNKQATDIVKHQEAMGEHAAKQTAADESVEAANRETTEGAFRKAGESKATYDKRVSQQNADYSTKRQGVEAANRQARDNTALRTRTEESLKKGHQAVGESVADADKKLRVEGNEKYSAIREATAQDPGVPLADLSREAEVAQSMLKGSPENIKQFRELIRKAPEAQGVQTSAGFVSPGDPLYEALSREGALDTGGSIPFDQLQGYSSEIGSKLARGGLQGDVYQALKYLKEKIDAAKTTIAERSGVGPQLKEADSFWHSYMDTFYDKDSAVAKVRGNVGVRDPQFYAEPFTTGKSAEVGAQKLRGIKSRHAEDLAKIADTALELRKTHAGLKAIPTTKESPVPAPPRPINKPAPVEVEYQGRKVVPAPEPPSQLTPDDIRKAREEKVYSASSTMGRVRPYEAVGLLLSAIGGKGLYGAGTVAALEGISRALSTDVVRDFISKPTVADLKYVDTLPEPQRAQLRSALEQAIGESKKSGKALPISPSLTRALGIAAKPPANRREAREMLAIP